MARLNGIKYRTFFSASLTHLCQFHSSKVITHFSHPEIQNKAYFNGVRKKVFENIHPPPPIIFCCKDILITKKFHPEDLNSSVTKQYNFKTLMNTIEIDKILAIN